MSHKNTTDSASRSDQVRHTHPSDLPQLYRICLHTANSGQTADDLFEDADLPGLLYMAPYVAHAPEHAFSLVRDGRAVGYIVGTADSHELSTWLTEHWWPVLADRVRQGQTAASALEAQMTDQIRQPPAVPAVARDYPAHLHINLLPEAQGGGNGGKLMTAFLDSLRQRQVTGVHLILSADNTRAFNFYRKCGFREWPDPDPDSITMVQALQEF